ncbi:MAG: YfhO family protein [Myxococcota bacterium]|jgi:hypothetical protein|nr:YfhO family protein [Myxococcota bacterium]
MTQKLLDFLKKETGVWLLLALVLILFADILMAPASHLLSQVNLDMDIQFLAWRSFGFSELAKGNLALWNPHIYSGTPFFAGAQSALLYPPNWLHLIMPLPAAINLNIILHVYLMGLCTYLWGRGHHLSILASTFMGTLVMLSGPFFLRIHSGHLPHLNVMPWFPLILLALDKMRNAFNFRWLMLGVFALVMQILAGHPQYTFYGALAALLYGFLSPEKTSYRHYLLGFVSIYILGAACSAVQLLSILDATAESIRSQALSYDFASAFSLPPENFLTLFLPFGLGNEVQLPYQGRWYYWEACIYGGLISTLILLTTNPKTFRQNTKLYIMLGILILLILGAYTPLHLWLYQHMPGFDRFRSPAKFSIYFILFFALLCAQAFDRLKQDKNMPVHALTTGIFTALLYAFANFCKSSQGLVWAEEILLQMQASGETFHNGAPAPTLEMVTGFISDHIYWQAFLATGLTLAFALPLQRLRPTLILCLMVIEVLSVALPLRTTRPFFYDYPAPWRETLAQSPKDIRVFHDNSIAANQGMAFGSNDLWGYDPLVLKRYAQFMHFALAGHDPEQANQYLPKLSFPPILNMLRAAYVFQNNKSEPVKPLPDPLERLELIYKYTLPANDSALLNTLISADFNPKDMVLLEEEPDTKPTQAHVKNKVTIKQSDTDFFDAEIFLETPAIVLITDNYSKGWHAKDLKGQQKYRMMRANYTLSAIALESGHHHIRVEYRPLAFRLGAWVSILSIVGLAFSALIISKRRRKNA